MTKWRIAIGMRIFSTFLKSVFVVPNIFAKFFGNFSEDLEKFYGLFQFSWKLFFAKYFGKHFGLFKSQLENFGGILKPILRYL